MFESLTPQLLVSMLILYLLFAWGLSLGLRDFRHSLKEGRRHIILEIKSGTVSSFAELLREVKPPFAFEVSVHHLGKDRHFYLIVRGSRKDEIKLKFRDAKMVGDYNPYHPGGVHKGFYLKSDKERPILDFKSLDFSKVNEVGEGAFLQIVVNGDGKGPRAANVRVFASAPTPYQADEIIMALKPSFSDFRMIEGKTSDFFGLLNARVFDEGQLVTWD